MHCLGHLKASTAHLGRIWFVHLGRWRQTERRHECADGVRHVWLRLHRCQIGKVQVGGSNAGNVQHVSLPTHVAFVCLEGSDAVSQRLGTRNSAHSVHMDDWVLHRLPRWCRKHLQTICRQTASSGSCSWTNSRCLWA
jgi:hypothetical protein